MPISTASDDTPAYATKATNVQCSEVGLFYAPLVCAKIRHDDHSRTAEEDLGHRTLVLTAVRRSFSLSLDGQ